MATNELETAYQAGEPIDQSHINELTLALLGDFVGRNATGIPLAEQNLGTSLIPWGNAYIKNLILNGSLVDSSALKLPSNRIISGKTNIGSTKSNFLKPLGVELKFKVLGAEVPLEGAINNTPLRVIDDLEVATQAGTGAWGSLVEPMNFTKYKGEEVGEFELSFTTDQISVEALRELETVAIRNNATGEIFIGDMRVTQAIEDVITTVSISNTYRGYFFNKDLESTGRFGITTYGDRFELLSLGWVFLDRNASTVDVSYSTPMYGEVLPSTAVVGQYFFVNSEETFYRYSSGSWFKVDRLLLGVVASDAVGCVGARSFDFFTNFKEDNTVEVAIKSSMINYTDIAHVTLINKPNNVINVNGVNLNLNYNTLKWTYPDDMDSSTDTVTDNTYYFYITDSGVPKLSTIAPYHRPDLFGYYHPFEMWRCVAEGKLDTSEEFFLGVTSFKYNKNITNSYGIYVSGMEGSASFGNVVAGGQTKRMFNPPLFAENTNHSNAALYLDLVNSRLYIPRGMYQCNAFSSAKVTGSFKTAIVLRNVANEAVKVFTGVAIVGDTATTKFANADTLLLVEDDNCYIELFTETTSTSAFANGLGNSDFTVGFSIGAQLELRRLS